MCPRHVGQVDRIAVLVESTCLAVALVVSKAVLHPDDDPNSACQYVSAARPGWVTNHRFVKTTPKPSATKNSKGELVGPPPPPLPEPVPVVVGLGRANVVVDAIVAQTNNQLLRT